MNERALRVVKILSLVALAWLGPGRAWGVHYPLPPSANDYGMKYEVVVTDLGGDKLDVAFTLIDGGRLKPIHSVAVIALRSLGGGSYAYDVKTTIDLKPTPDGRRAGRVQIPKQFANAATFRVLTLHVDGKPQRAGAALYKIPLNKFPIGAKTLPKAPLP